jgi:adenosylmethionine-8-amino-7-oxononanoate aminotransferase
MKGAAKSHVFHRKLKGFLPMAVKAEGAWIEDADGKRYVDASGGPILVNVGHGRKEIADAVSAQILQCDYTHPTMFTTSVVEELADRLAAHTPAGIDRFYFLTGGAEAVETAVKLARRIHLAQGRPHKFRLVSRWNSYHGLTLGALAAAGRTSFRVHYAPMLNDAVHIPPPYCLRCPYGLVYPTCGLCCAKALEHTLLNLGPETVSAFIAETVSGATLAAVTPPPGYWQEIRNICDRHEVLLILDEVMAGLGRTGRWFAAEHYDVVPDLLTMGKGLGGGGVALSAVGVRNTHFESVRDSDTGFVHGGTYSHHNVAAAAGCAVLKIIESEGLVERVDRLGKVLGDRLRQWLGTHPHVGDIRGIGFMWGVEFVKDRATLAPFPREAKVVERLWDALFQDGIIAYKSSGLAGRDGDALMLGPPFIIDEELLERVVEGLAKGVRSVLG